jgi:small ligand-binding sensory domain FIST
MTRAASRLVLHPFDEQRVRDTAAELRAEVGRPSLALAFVTPDYLAHLADFQELVTIHGHVTQVVGCTGSGLIGTACEAEMASGFSLLFLTLDGPPPRVVSLTQSDLEASRGDAFWQGKAGDAVKSWLALANPFAFDTDTWLKEWTAALAGSTCFGALASGTGSPEEAAVFGPGPGEKPDAVIIGFPDTPVEAMVSQGCRPIGEALLVTNADEHLLLELGSRPAYEVLEQAFATLPDAEKQRARGNLFAGLAVDEYKHRLRRGDFLVRNILGADPASGVVVVGARPRPGQTLQYQIRDAASAHEELASLLTPASLRPDKPAASLLFCCIGRGKNLFGVPHHDAATLADHIGPLPSAGFFCNGEIGPVGGTSFLHSYSASIGLIY